MSKKSLLVLAMTLSMVAILAIGGTLAYFTDTETKTNKFTTGKVDIDLVEKFDEDKANLLPGKENAVQKEVSITLKDGSEDSYVWYTYKIPAVLDSTDGSTGTNNVVHVNAYGYTWDTYRKNQAYWPEGTTSALPLEKTWDHDANVEIPSLIGPEGRIGQEEIDKIMYNVYVVLYHGVLEAGKSTSVGMSQVYMDAGVDTNDEGKYLDKNGKVIDFDFSKGLNIIVDAYAIQANIADADADGDVDVYDAYITYNK